MTVTGFLHPGAMGATIAAACSGERLWASAARSAATAARAKQAGLTDTGTLEAMVARADMIIAVCPPEASEAVAGATADAGFGGTYVDANAISPATTRRIGARFERYVDGGIVGPPAVTAGTTRLYLSGVDAATVAERFAESVVEARVIEGGPGAASALKMAYAAWTKGTAALLFATRALAEAEGVAQPLLDEWARSQPELPGRLDRSPRTVAPKAWRWVGEMHEIAASFETAGLPDGFHQAAAEVYKALAPYRDRDTADGSVDGTLDRITIADVVSRLLDQRT